MSTVIDDRVVQMQFDNKNFETNVQESLKTIDKLNTSLKATETTDAFETLDRSAKRLNFDSLANAVETVSSRFSTLGVIGMAVLQNLASKAVDTGIKIAKSLSVDQLMAGWNKYAEKTTSVQTIMAATSSTWEEDAKNIGFLGTQMDYVEGQMEKLNWFTDETSYNFTDMVSNIGKFTSNGVKLSDASTAMQGIATWAAISGQNAQKASQAMYNISQAMGTGAMKVMDWKSIENANMATMEFKQAALEAAEAQGLLKKDLKATKKTGVDTWKTNVKGAKRVAVTVETFRDSLNKGWFTKDVMMQVFNEYGGAADALYNISEKATKSFTTSEIIDFVDAYADGSKSLDEISKTMGIDADVLRKNLDYLTSDVGKFGLKTFKAAQEAKTFQEVIDATKDAVSTGWMRIFQDIFGNYEEAKVIWTGLANFLYDIFAEPLNAAHDILVEWKDKGGWAAIFDQDTGALWRLGDAFKAVIAPAKQAFHDIFPQTSNAEWWVNLLLRFSEGFSKLVTKMKPSEKTANRLKRVFRGLFAVVDMGKSFFEALGRVIKEFVYPAFSKFFDGLTKGAAIFGDLLVFIRNYMKEHDVFYEGLKKVAEFVIEKYGKVKEAIEGLIEKFYELTGIDLHLPKFESLGDVFEYIRKKGGQAKDAIDNIKLLIEAFKSGFRGEEQVQVVGDGVGKINEASTFFHNLGQSFGEFVEKVKEFIGYNPEKISETWDKIVTILGKLAEKLKELGKIVGDNAWEKIKEIFNGKGLGLDKTTTLIAGALAVRKVYWMIKDLIDDARTIHQAKKIVKSVSRISESIESFFYSMEYVQKSKALKNVAIALGIITASLIALAFVDSTSLAAGLVVLSSALFIMIGALELMHKNTGAAISMVILSVALLLLVPVIKKLGEMKFAEVAQGIGALAFTIGIFAGAAKLCEGSAGSLILLSVAMLLMDVALAAFIPSFQKLGQMTWDEIARAIVAFAGAMMILVVAAMAAEALPVGFLALAAALAALGLAAVLVGLGIDLTAVGIEKLASIPNLGQTAVDLEQIALSLTQLGGAGIIDLFGSLGTGAMALAFSSLAEHTPIIAESLPTVVDSLEKFGKLKGQIGSSKDVASGIKDMAKALVDFSKSKEDVKKAVNSIADVSKKIKSLAESSAKMGTGMFQFSQAMTMVLAAGDLFNQVVIKIATGMTLLATSASALKTTGAVDAIERTATSMTKFATATEKLAEGLTTSVSAMTTFVMLKSEVEAAVPATKKAVMEFLKQIVQTMRDQLASFRLAGQTLIAGVATGMLNAKANVVNAAASVSRSAVSEVRGFRNEFYSAGAYLSEGLAAGILSKKSTVENAAESVANAAANRAKQTMSEHSPSKVGMEIGAYFTLGMAIGIRSAGKEAEDATEATLTGVLETANALAQMIREKLEEESSPVITPVLDTSLIESGATRFKNTLRGITIPSTYSKASLAGAAFASGAIQNGSGEIVNSTNNYFTQNNYSPKSLSRIDIYRQTKNLFTAEKGAVKR